MFQRIRRNARMSPYLLLVMIGSGLALVMWCVTLFLAFDADPHSSLSRFTLAGLQRSLGIACLLSLITSVLLLRAAWQIWHGTRRYREFPPRRPALLRPVAILRGIDAERGGDLCMRLAVAHLFVSIGIVAGTVWLIVL